MRFCKALPSAARARAASGRCGVALTSAGRAGALWARPCVAALSRPPGGVDSGRTSAALCRPAVAGTDPTVRADAAAPLDGDDADFVSTAPARDAGTAAGRGSTAPPAERGSSICGPPAGTWLAPGFDSGVTRPSPARATSGVDAAVTS